MNDSFDVVIVGGGPAGLAAALTLGRACKRVVLCDAGSRRNAAAVEIHNFVTRDGVPPAEFRRIAREQLEAYPNVDIRDAPVDAILGSLGAFEVHLGDARVRARRVLLCTGMIDELPPLEGFRELWGRSIFICPYCHGWEVRDRRFGYLAHSAEAIEFAAFLRGWSRDVVLLTDGRFSVAADAASRLARHGVRVETRALARLVAGPDGLERVEFASGAPLPLDVLFAHPPQRQVDLVRGLGLEVDARGYVKVDDMRRETSRAGIFAAGDLLTPAQGALLAAASGTQAAGMINHALTLGLPSGEDSA